MVRRRRAYTLIEVLTVLIVLTLTMGLGYASLTSATNGSYTQIAQGYLTETITAEQTFYNEYGLYTPYPADLTGISSPLVVLSSPVTATSQVSIAVGSVTGDLALAYIDGNGNCQLDLVAPPVTTQTASPTTTTVPTVAAGTSCSADLALTTETPVPVANGGTAK